MDNKAASPKEKDTKRGSGGLRDRQNMDNKGARPKEKNDTMRGSAEYRETQHMDSQLPPQLGNTIKRDDPEKM